jgi:hypothetical protein
VYLTWQYMVKIPSYNFLIIFYIIFILVSEATIFRLGEWYSEKKQRKKMI